MNPIIFCLLLLTIFSCKKVGDDSSQEFIGYWHARLSDYDHVFINIDEKSFGFYTILWQGKEIHYSGVIRVNDKHIYLGGLYSFDIIEYPHQIDTSIEREFVSNHNDFSPRLANWKMTLYGLKPAKFHVCGNWTYYKADY